MAKYRSSLLKFHLLLLGFLLLNFVFRMSVQISVNYQIVFVAKILLYVSGLILFFSYLKPIKKRLLYFSFFALSPVFILVSWLIDGIFGAILVSIVLFCFAPEDSRLNDSGIHIYKNFSGFMAHTSHYEITQPKLLLFEKIIADFEFDKNLYFEKKDLQFKNDNLQIRMILKKYDHVENHYFAKDTTLQIQL
ncbi:MAG: hypothetical protein EOO50_05540 [Flavobacterium sp.]|uniref:hypothetical protein n=1 Tax=Flavobacterium sp. TaxID=239 RepID=UPI001209ABCF|nr:hypothetical protein [Flavobacterium sp.]RZJ67451.1 MAG: hypothetical protein EOO50_05540 [Flavobacterium sp.]